MTEAARRTAACGRKAAPGGRRCKCALRRMEWRKNIVLYGGNVSTNASLYDILKKHTIMKEGVFMGGQEPESGKKQICAGLLAHVDAGKTTLSEAMLYLSGKIKKPGRVDHRDSYLDNHQLERERGITIFSKQALFSLPHTEVTLLDTPGHVDFSAEAERSLQVLDYAVLVISGTDGVQAHTETLWRLLKRYSVPAFLFISKMDLPGADRTAVMDSLRARLDEGCVDFGLSGETLEDRLAMCDEAVMEKYLSAGALDSGDVARLIAERKLFPCFFGSGLRLEGVEALLDALDQYTRPVEDRGKFAAKVFKISRDAQGNRLTWLKVTGGELRVRAAIKYKDENGGAHEEKPSQLRFYSGIKYDTADRAVPGQVCAVLGLSASYPGQGLGAEPESGSAVLEPVLSYQVLPPPGTDPALLYPKLQLLQEEDPQLKVVWNGRGREISVRLMGKVQTEIFKRLVLERFDLAVGLGRGQIMYRETIANKVEGVGHFEPLRHYAEVHLILEPLPLGSGIVLDSICSEDELDRNWQRLILSHLQDRQHPGVLTGSPITDMKISLAAGRAHLKHTEGGDFRQAVFRALRQGLMQAESVLLEPYYSFRLQVPPEQIGRAINDVRAMNGSFSSPVERDGMLCLEGSAPVAAMSGYSEELKAYTHGLGRLSCRMDGYRPCREQKAVVESIGYDAESDTENPADSVFCAHGAGFNVKWDRVPEYMHLESCLREKKEPEAPPPLRRSLSIDERELEEIMQREFGPIRRPEYRSTMRNEAPSCPAPAERKQEYLIVDGYNLIFSWEELKSLAAERLDLARTRLMDMLSNYCGYTRAQLVLVFDGFRTPGNPGSRMEYHNIHVAYTKDGETGDAYIERLAGQIGKNYAVRVVTSDNLIRLSALRSGVLRTSSKEFIGELEWVLGRIEALLQTTNAAAHKTRLKDGIQQ